MTSPILFAGPSSRDLQAELLDGLRVRAPVRRGDVDEAVRGGSPDVLVIVDGTFFSYPSVGHSELLRAINLGWEVWGLSSMGAIRAAEMHTFGMRGYGTVFSAFLAPEYDDDEVALLHNPEPPYTPYSEPLIHIRLWANALAESEEFDGSTQNRLIHAMKHRWFGERTRRVLQDWLTAETRISAERATYLVAELDHYQQKSKDLADFLAERPWERNASISSQ